MEYLKLVNDFIDNSVILNSTFSALVQHEHNIKTILWNVIHDYHHYYHYTVFVLVDIKAKYNETDN